MPRNAYCLVYSQQVLTERQCFVLVGLKKVKRFMPRAFVIKYKSRNSYFPNAPSCKK